MNFCIRKNVSLGYENTMQASEAFVQQRVGDIAVPQAQHKATSPARKTLVARLTDITNKYQSL